MMTRDSLKKAACKSKSPILMASYRQARNKVNSLSIQLEKQYFSTKISECKGNMKESWKTINELLNKRSKSCNIDCIKDSGNAIVSKKEISDTMNSFFCTICEKSWKLARVTPIFKEGDKTEKSNYRPISVLPVISRLFERLVANQLYQHMNDNGYFSLEQSGFLHLHSTVTCLLKNTDDWYNGLDLGKLVGVVFIDLKKAFDTVDHDILYRKIEHYGIQQQQLAWFKYYIQG